MPQAPFPSDGFSGVVRFQDGSWAFGLADRAHEIPNTVATRFGIASGTKAFTRIVACARPARRRPAADRRARHGAAGTASRSSSRREYCNAGYVVLALLAERATGTSFYDLVQQQTAVGMDVLASPEGTRSFLARPGTNLDQDEVWGHRPRGRRRLRVGQEPLYRRLEPIDGDAECR